MGDQDWTPVTVTKTAKQRTAGMSSAQAISQVFEILPTKITMHALAFIDRLIVPPQ